MSDGIAIKVENLSKVYKLYNSPVERLKESLHPMRRQYHHDFYALNNISFEIKQGESIGIIGKNGSGKSTLLKILTGVLTPTSGKVTVNGKVSALLELGAGFNPELSGIENVYFNGLLMGYTQEEMDLRLDDILSFADIGEFVYQPVKTYSSGMFIRLAFAVSINVDPEILIVDEALSVGDIYFQQKCYAKIREKINNGITMIFVSHDSAAVMNLCKRTILLDSGVSIYDGSSIESVSRFLARVGEQIKHSSVIAPINGNNPLTLQESNNLQMIANSILTGSEERHGGGGAKIIAVQVLNQQGSDSLSVSMFDSITFRILIRAQKYVQKPNVGVHLFDRLGNLVFACGTRNLGIEIPSLSESQELLLALKLMMNVQSGEYTFSIGVSEPAAQGPNAGFVLERVDNLGPLSVVPTAVDIQPFYGIAKLPFELTDMKLL